MQDTVSTGALSQLLDQFSVPMFAVERSGPFATFRFVSMNKSMAAAAGRTAVSSIGRSMFDLLDVAEAEVANNRLLECALTRNVLRYRERFTTSGTKSIWDTTLQFVPLSGAGERVLGTSILLSSEDTATPEVTTLEDINYISTMADFQLQNLVSLFETYRSQELFRPEAAPRIAKLGGMCRSIQRAVIDIKKIADRAQRMQQPPAAAAETSVVRATEGTMRCSDTVRALVEYSQQGQS